MAEKHVHKVYGSFPPWGKSIEFPANGGGGGNYVYFDTSSITEFGAETDALYGCAYLIKEPTWNGAIVVSTSGWRDGDTPPLAVSVDMNLKTTTFDESGYPVPEMPTIGEYLAKYEPWILDLPRLTEEEFYKIPPQFTLMYGDEPKTFFYIEGMTWGEWVNSDYSSSMFVCVDGYVLFKSNGSNVVNSTSGRYMECNDVIDNNYTFYLGGGVE